MSANQAELPPGLHVLNTWLAPKDQDTLVPGKDQYRYDARELHAFLEARMPFGLWFYWQAKHYSLQVDRHYICPEMAGASAAAGNAKMGRRPNRKDYLLTHDVMRTLSCGSITAKGAVYRDAVWDFLDFLAAVGTEFPPGLREWMSVSSAPWLLGRTPG